MQQVLGILCEKQTNKHTKTPHFLTDNELVKHLYCTYCSHVIGHTGSFWFCSLFSVSNFTFLNITVFSETFFFFKQAMGREFQFLHNTIEKLYVPYMTIAVKSKYRSISLIYGS